MWKAPAPCLCARRAADGRLARPRAACPTIVRACYWKVRLRNRGRWLRGTGCAILRTGWLWPLRFDGGGDCNCGGGGEMIDLSLLTVIPYVQRVVEWVRSPIGAVVHRLAAEDLSQVRGLITSHYRRYYAKVEVMNRSRKQVVIHHMCLRIGRDATITADLSKKIVFGPLDFERLSVVFPVEGGANLQTHGTYRLLIVPTSGRTCSVRGAFRSSQSLCLEQGRRRRMSGRSLSATSR